MSEIFDRLEKLLGKEAVDVLNSKTVMIFGIGGVGGYVTEALCRAGIQNFVLIDNDTINESNLNRQIIALQSTLGKSKVEVMKQRILDINPQAMVEVKKEFVTPDILKNYNFENIDYVVDAIDNVTAKISLAVLSSQKIFKLISCMGTGNKLKPELFEITDIKKTSVCPLAKVIRKKLKELGVEKLNVLYSKEEPININSNTPASISFTPSIAGLRIAEYVIKDFLNLN